MEASSSTPDKGEQSENTMVSEAPSLSPDTSDLNISTNLQSQASLKTEEYRQLFRLPPEEILIQDFNCAIQESIIIQGHLYMFMGYICFYSNIFGFETKRIITFHDITCVRKAKTAGIFPNAIEILADGKKYFFTSFLSRDEAFNLINDRLVDLDNIAKSTTNESYSIAQEEKHTLKDTHHVGTENGSSAGFQISDIDSFERFDHCSSSNIHLPTKNEDGTSMQTPDNTRDTSDGDATTLIRSDISFPPSTKISWRHENLDSPKIPESYVKVATSKFPIRVEEFFTLFFSDEAVNFLELFHEKCGDKDFSCGLWRPCDEYGHTRNIAFRHPIKIYFGAKFGSCEEVQKFRVYRNSHLIIETSQEVKDAPYGDYFSVQGLWDVDQDGDESNQSCILNIYINVAFSKKTFWKGKIEQASIEECREAYATWINIAHDLLKQKNLLKQEGIKHEDGSGDKKEAEEQVASREEFFSVGDEVSNPSKVSATPGPKSRHFRHVWWGEVLEARLRMSNQTKLLLLVVVFAAAILLTQMGMVVLMHRLPHHEIHIIREAESVRGGEYSVVWLQLQIQHLKDEMVMVESSLERMREDHSRLRRVLDRLPHV